MKSDRIPNIDRRTRLGYISLSEEEEEYVRSTMSKMNQTSLNVGRNVGGKFARLAILLLCDLYNYGKLNRLSEIKDECEMREHIQNILKTIR